MARRIAICLALGFAVTIGGCGTTTAMENRGPSLGHLKHRGKMYDLRDLFDPAFRAASDDEFIRLFNPETTLALDWAGL